MQIINNVIYKLDYKKITKFNNENEFTEFTQNLINDLSEKKDVRECVQRETKNDVVDYIKNIILNNQNEEQTSKLYENIVKRLLNVEKDAQLKVKDLGTKIKTGSIFESMSKLNDNTYNFIIAKVEHSEFFDDENFSFKTGFPKNNKKIWKSCLMECSLIDGDINVNKILIYTSNKAKYWHDKFLECDAKNNDKDNTKNCMKFVNDCLIKRIKTVSLSDYYILRGSLIHQFLSKELFNYCEAVEELLNEYSPNDVGVKEKLLELEKELLNVSNVKFDKSFTPDKKTIKKFFKINYKIRTGIDINLDYSIDSNVDSYIEIYTENDKKFVKIEIDDNSNIEKIRK